MLNIIFVQFSVTIIRKRRVMVVVKQYEVVNNREEISYKKMLKNISLIVFRIIKI